MADIGIGTYGNPKIYNWGGIYDDKCIIGKYCSIADNVTIIVDGDHRMDWRSQYAHPYTGHPKRSGSVIIGNDVWIGYGAIIICNNIGNGAVIGAGSVVVKDVKPYEVVAGNPARHIRFRFDEETIARLEKDPWWEWSKDKIYNSLPSLCTAP